MAAYPDARPDVLNPLILGKMLELAKDMGITLPVCGHEPLTSRWAARCLDAQDNLQHWAHMATWTGDPARDGERKGWAPSKVVHIPDDVGIGDLAAAAPRWDPRRRPYSCLQALADVTVEIPPGSQMLVPLRYRKRFGEADAAARTRGP
ncbi:unnamed protein product [Lampetra fluviatilis]